MTTSTVPARRVTILSSAIFVVTLLLAVKQLTTWIHFFNFDDAFMFYRYAMNARAGYGVAWNPAGPHVFGLTSLPWFVIVLAATYIFHDPARLLAICSCVTGIVALACMAYLPSRRAKSFWLGRFTIVFPLIALPLLLDKRFLITWFNGMETMLGLLVLAAFVEVHERIVEKQSFAKLVLLVLLGTLAVMTRPEALICVLAFPLLAWLISDKQMSSKYLGAFFAGLAVLIAAYLVFNSFYFGSAVPLAFYAKAKGGYDGYRPYLSPFVYSAMFASICAVPVITLALFTHRRNLRRVLPFLLTAVLMVLYLLTVTQIMGWQARYYIPFMPFLYVPAIAVADDAFVNGFESTLWTGWRISALSLAVFFCCPYALEAATMISHIIAKHRSVYIPPVFNSASDAELPTVNHWKAFQEFAHALPSGTTVASSEVGYFGADAPQVAIIDEVGLNDTHLARHPMDVDYLFSRKPDVIWLPHPDYTRLYGTLSADPRLVRDYVFYRGAFDFGLAIRKDSPHYAEITALFTQAWAKMYPSYDMAGFRMQSVTWDPNRKVHTTTEDAINP